MPQHRLVTVTGPGGSGKSRVALAVAGRLEEVFAGAVAFVPLMDLTHAGEVIEAVVKALGLPHTPQSDPWAQALAALSRRPWLLVMDNLEHLLPDGAREISRLLARVPSLTCLATSRQRLNLAGEQEFALLPLPTPRSSVFGVRSSVFGSDTPKAEHRIPRT
jgi:predicted ATPase